MPRAACDPGFGCASGWLSSLTRFPVPVVFTCEMEISVSPLRACLRVRAKQVVRTAGHREGVGRTRQSGMLRGQPFSRD